jgi:hypothetical protein
VFLGWVNSWFTRWGLEVVFGLSYHVVYPMGTRGCFWVELTRGLPDGDKSG